MSFLQEKIFLATINSPHALWPEIGHKLNWKKRKNIVDIRSLPLNGCQQMPGEKECLGFHISNLTPSRFLVLEEFEVLSRTCKPLEGQPARLQGTATCSSVWGSSRGDWLCHHHRTGSPLQTLENNSLKLIPQKSLQRTWLDLSTAILEMVDHKAKTSLCWLPVEVSSHFLTLLISPQSHQ